MIRAALESTSPASGRGSAPRCAASTCDQPIAFEMSLIAAADAACPLSRLRGRVGVGALFRAQSTEICASRGGSVAIRWWSTLGAAASDAMLWRASVSVTKRTLKPATAQLSPNDGVCYVAWTTDRADGGVRHRPQPRRCAVFDSDVEQKRALECLRLASDLMQLSRETLNPNLKAHCLRMADVWTDQAGPPDDPASPKSLFH
jgi:hypothetical protein